MEDIKKSLVDSERSVESRLNTAFPEVPQTSESFFVRRTQDVLRGFNQVEEIGGGALFVCGKVTGWTSLKDYGEKFSINAGRSAVRNSPRVGSLSKTENLGDICEYGAEVILESVPLLVASMVILLMLRKCRRSQIWKNTAAWLIK